MRRFLPRPTSSKAYLHHIPMTGPAHAVPEPPSTARIRAIIVARMARTSVYQTSRSDCRQTGPYQKWCNFQFGGENEAAGAAAAAAWAFE